jgi:D-galactarolactone cycloisomerase
MARITSIKTHLLQHDLAEPFGFSQWFYAKRQALLVEISDESGPAGWGECYGPAAVTQCAIQEVYAPLLIGWNPLCNEAAWQHCWRATLDFARKGIMMGAMSGLDMALLDLKGKLLEVSVSELMGGRVRDTVACYATGMYFKEMPEDDLLEVIIEEARGYVESGYRALKIKVGKNLDFDIRQIRRMREAFPDCRLMADSNHAFDLSEALTVGRVLDECGYGWFEEPLSPQHPELFRQLADKIDTPLATGECEQTRWGFTDLTAAGGVHILQPDLAYCGGPTEALKIRALASSRGIQLIPHAWGTQLNLAAALHLLASTYTEPGRREPEEPLLERDCTPNPMRDELFFPSLEIRDGTALVPNAPGLGVEPDPDKIKKFQINQTERK